MRRLKPFHRWRLPRPPRLIATLTATARQRRLLAAIAGVTGVLGTWSLLGAPALAALDAARQQAGQTAQRLAADAGLRLGQITLSGRRHAAQDDVLAALGITRGEPVLAIDPQAARARLESLGWVKSATVERHLPGHLHISLIERTPLFIWQLGEHYRLVDADGVVIADHRSDFAHLPLIVGQGAPAAAADLFTMLGAEPEIRARTVAATRISGRRWDLHLDALGEQGITVRLPEFDAPRALATLARLAREERLLDRALTLIDLRVDDRLVVRLRPPVEGGAKSGEALRPRRAGITTEAG